ncbi:MAG: ATP-binding cassette domain-containing protein [Beutenbergiaceae bacterium]
MLLRIEGLHVAHGQRQVLKGLDLSVYRGEILGVIGRNGAGKSTLVNIISGRLHAAAGSVHLNGEPFRPDSVEAALAAGVTVVEQDFRPPVELTVAQAIFRRTFLADRTHAELRDHAHRVAEKAHVWLDFDAPVAELDTAQQALVEVLRVVAEEAQLVILDEASVVLDDAEIVQLHYAARKLRELGCSIIYIAHRLDEVHAITDRVMVLRDGVASEVIESRRSKADDLAFAMLHHPVQRATRPAPREDTEPCLRISGLSSENLAPLDLEVQRGEVVAVVGMRGSGATELLQAISGQRPAHASSIMIQDRRYHDVAEAASEVTSLGERSEADPGSSIADALAAGSQAPSEIGRLRDAATTAHRLEIATSDIGGQVSTLSGGDQRKVAVVSAAAVDEPVVVFQQPTRGVDIGAKQRVHEIIDNLAADGRAVLLSSNDLSEQLSLAHRFLVFFQGDLVADLANDDVNEDLLMAYAETGGSGEPMFVRANRRH